MKKITLISTLPPLIGLSPYTLGLVTALSQNAKIDFIGFKKIYPIFLYSGGGVDKNGVTPQFNKNVKVDNCLVWYNPITWIKAGLAIDTQIAHAQWWSWFLAPVFITVLGIAKLRGKKIIITIHNVKPHEKSWYKVLLNKSVLSLADEYVVHNQANKKLFLETDKSNKPVHVLPLGIFELTDPKMSVSQLRKKYGYSLKDRVVLYFGNIRDYKGLDVLINSFAYIKDKSVKLIIAGKPWKGFDEYQKLIDENNINKRTKLFLSYIPESQIPELFKLSSMAVFPYKEFEASSAAATNALNFAKPIVVTNTGGLTEVVMDKKVIAKPDNAKDLAIKIEYALVNQKKLAIESYKICQKFLWKNIVVDYLNKLYK